MGREEGRKWEERQEGQTNNRVSAVHGDICSAKAEPCVALADEPKARPRRALRGKRTLQPACIQPRPLRPPRALGTPPQAAPQTGAAAGRCTARSSRPPPPHTGISTPPLSHTRGIDSKVACSCLSLNSAAILLEEWPTIARFGQADGDWPELDSENVTKGALTTLS